MILDDMKWSVTGEKLDLWRRLFIITSWPSVTHPVAIHTPEICSTKCDWLLKQSQTTQKHRQSSGKFYTALFAWLIDWPRRRQFNKRSSKSIIAPMNLQNNLFLGKKYLINYEFLSPVFYFTFNLDFSVSIN